MMHLGFPQFLTVKKIYTFRARCRPWRGKNWGSEIVIFIARGNRGERNFHLFFPFLVT